MKNYPYVNLLLFTLCIIVWHACTDEQAIRKQARESEAYFDTFGVDPELAVIAGILKHRNDSVEFASVLKREYGQPLWRKAFCFQEDDGNISYVVPFIWSRDDDEVSALWFFLLDGSRVYSRILLRADAVGKLSDLQWTFDYATRYALMKTPSTGLAFNGDVAPVKTRAGDYITYTRCNHVVSYVPGTNIYDDKGYYCWSVTEYLSRLPDPRDGIQEFYRELSKGTGGGGGGGSIQTLPKKNAKPCEKVVSLTLDLGFSNRMKSLHQETTTATSSTLENG